MSTNSFPPECLRIAQLYERDPSFVYDLMLLHDVESLPLCRSPYDGYGAFVSDLTAVINNEPSITKQEFTQMADPNWIIDRHAAGQDISMFLNQRQPASGDFTDQPSTLQEVLNNSIQVRNSFADLPQDIRQKFNNNPLTFIDFVMDPNNAGKLVELGLVEKPAEATVPAVVPSPASAKEGAGEGA